MLLSSEHLSLCGEHPKFFPKFVGSIIIKELRGVNTVELQIPPLTRFSLIDPVVTWTASDHTSEDRLTLAPI